MGIGSLAYLPISLVVFALSWTLFRGAAGSMSLRKLNIVSWLFYLHFFALTFIAATLTVLGVSHYVIDTIAPRFRILSYIAICYIMIITPLTMLGAQNVLFGGRIRSRLRDYFASPVTIGNNQSILWICLTIISALATIYVYVVIRRIPFVSFLQSSSILDLAAARIDAKQEFPGIVYIKNIFSLTLAPFVSYVIYGYARVYRKRSYWIWFFIAFLVAVMALTYSGEKAPIIRYLACLFFAHTFIRGGASRKSILFAGLGAVLLMILAYVFFSGAAFSVDLLRGISSRIFQSQFAGFPLVLSIFPDMHPFLEGASFPSWLASLIGQEHVRSARIAMEVFNPTAVSEGTAGVMNSIFMAEAWANFGWAGFLFAPIWVGFLIQFTHNSLLVAPKTPLTIALMVYLMNAIPITGGFMEFFWNPILIIIGGLVIVASMLHFSGGTVYIRTRLRFRRPGLGRMERTNP